MIVRNEAHIISELFDTVAPYIHTWVIVDTGSDDGTQDVIRGHMAELGIPGELHERPWRNFGHNRSEALALAQGHADYIWVMDADDLVLGTLDLSALSADRYEMLVESPGVSYWRAQIFRDGMPFRYQGVVHEVAVCDQPFSSRRLEGDYLVQSRRLGGRNLDPQKYQRDVDLLMAEVERNPNDARSVFYIARSYNCLRDWTNTRTWYLRRAEMGGWEEEVFYSLWRAGTAMEMLGEPWPQVLDAYLRAWEYRPRRAEPLHDIAVYYRRNKRWTLGRLFAERAAAIPLPDDSLFVNRDVYRFRALDEQSVCASWIGRTAEAFDLCRRILAVWDDVPESEHPRIMSNWEFLAKKLMEQTKEYPAALVPTLAAEAKNAEVTVSIAAGADVAATERTLNSFLNCCSDLSSVGRFLIVDHALSEADRQRLADIYPFAEISLRCPAEPGQIRSQVHGRYWLHIGEGWQFFATEPYIARLSQVLGTEPDVFAVGLNVDDAHTFPKVANDGAPVVKVIDWETRQDRLNAPVGARTDRHIITDASVTGPVMVDTARFDRHQAGEAMRSATLDEVFCVSPAAGG